MHLLWQVNLSDNPKFHGLFHQVVDYSNLTLELHYLLFIVVNVQYQYVEQKIITTH